MELPAEFATFGLYDWKTSAPNTQLHYIRTEDKANECIARVNSRPGPLTIGLDVEWRPNFAAGKPENPVALVQIACDDEILLVQVSAMRGTVGPLEALTRYSANS
jgi:exonuclease 3'-5' domain-containing protein 2